MCAQTTSSEFSFTKEEMMPSDISQVTAFEANLILFIIFVASMYCLYRFGFWRYHKRLARKHGWEDNGPRNPGGVFYSIVPCLRCGTRWKRLRTRIGEQHTKNSIRRFCYCPKCLFVFDLSETATDTPPSLTKVNKQDKYMELTLLSNSEKSKDTSAELDEMESWVVEALNELGKKKHFNKTRTVNSIPVEWI
jgi:hypothetical protein